MSDKPIPLLFEPIYKPKPWGGRKLCELFGKSLPGDEPIGESWELVDLPGNVSIVRGGALAGQSLADVLARWGGWLFGDRRASTSGTEPGRYDDTTSGTEPGRYDDVAPGRYGCAAPAARFPLLIKFLDARQHLSVQVHPRPDHPDVLSGKLPLKHEAWYVLDADPGAQIFIGFKPGVTEQDVRQHAGGADFADLLQAWPAEVGTCFYLPSGTPHALGGGTVVAEVQTPSDITYRFFDWNRVGLDGQPRELHIDQAIEHVRYDVGESDILMATADAQTAQQPTTRVCTCQSFTIDRRSLSGSAPAAFPEGELLIWIWLKGTGELAADNGKVALAAGDVALIPPTGTMQLACKDAELLEVRIPPA